MSLPSHQRRQRGFSTIHLIAFLVVMGLAQAGLMNYQAKLMSQARGKAIGGMQAAIRDAVDDYLKVWIPFIAANKPISLNGVTVANQLSPTLEELQALGHLHAPLTSPPHGGEWRIQIEEQPANCPKVKCNLASSIWATRPITVVGDPDRVDQIAINEALFVIGANGGYSEESDPDLIIGSGGWTRPNSNGAVAGTLLSIGGYGSTSFVALQTVGTPCDTIGSVATSTSGQQLICRGDPSIYTPVISALPSYASVGTKKEVRDGDIIPKPVCETGGIPAYSLEVNQSAIDVAIVPPLQAQYATADDLGTSWRIKIKLKDRNTTEVSGNTYNISAIIQVECYYK